MRGLIVALGLLAGTAHADVTVTFTTTPSGGVYAPRHVLVAWIETADGTFIKTLGRYAGIRKTSLTGWITAAGANDVDAISGATQDAHLARTVKWNLRDRVGAVLPDGQYVIKFESSDANPGGARNQASFTITKSPTSGNQGMNLSQGGFVNVNIEVNGATQSCGDGYEDAGETCDPGLADSCPTSCPPSTIECFQGVVAGNAALCTGQCVQQMITACANDDACCPDGCDGTTDNDCEGGGGGGDDDPNGGVSSCATSSDAGWLLALLGLFVLARRRR
jgi:MYXO-CTERM domain-containing protein